VTSIASVLDQPWPEEAANNVAEGAQAGAAEEALSTAAVYMGTVKAANSVRGFSIVECPDSGFEHDVFVHPSVAHPQVLSVNDVVAFQIGVSLRGLPQARPPLWKLVGWNRHDPPRLGEFVGHVRQVLLGGGAFIDCPEVTRTHGHDVFVNESVMSLCDLAMGDTIAFNVQIGAEGRPQMPSPCWKCCTEDPGDVPVDITSVELSPLPAGPVEPGTASELVAIGWASQRAFDSDEACVTSNSQEKQADATGTERRQAGDGRLAEFVETESEGGAIHQLPVHAHGTLPLEVKPLGGCKAEGDERNNDECAAVLEGAGAVGALIETLVENAAAAAAAGEAAIAKDEDVEQPEAVQHSARAVDDSTGAAHDVGALTELEGARVHEMASKADAVHNISIGIVRVADELEGFSMVNCPGSGFDHAVYVHSSVADPEVLAPDDVVAFTIRANAHGRPEACSPFWKLMGWNGQVRPTCFGEYQGRIGRAASNGCAVVTCREVAARHGMEAQVHDTVMNLCALTAGDRIAFNLHINAAGNPQVSAPVWRCCLVHEGVALEPGLACRECSDMPQMPAIISTNVVKKPVVAEAERKRKALPKPISMVARPLPVEGKSTALVQECNGPEVKRARVDSTH